MNLGALLAATIAQLERAGVPYKISGSVASSYHEEPRAEMAVETRLACMLLALALVAACGGQGLPSAVAAPAPVQTPAPLPSALPPATPNPCLFAATRLAAFSERLAGELAALRPLVVAARFDAARTASGARQVSATLTAYDGLEHAVGGCQATAPLSPRVALLRSSAEATLEKALTAGITDARVERNAAASLLGLLPEVLALSAAATGVADKLGAAVKVAQVPADATRPVGSLPPLPTPPPTPKPTPPPSAEAIAPSFFGAGVTISTYEVSGDTPSEISSSIGANGPYLKWLGGNAAGQTEMKSAYGFSYRSGSGACQIVITSSPAIRLTYTIVLPRWTAPSGAPPTTIRWWNAFLRGIATHEKVHVDIYRSTAARLNSALASSTCANAERHLDAVWNDAQRENCEFDMKEYGASAGLSLESCLAQ